MIFFYAKLLGVVPSVSTENDPSRMMTGTLLFVLSTTAILYGPSARRNGPTLQSFGSSKYPPNLGNVEKENKLTYILNLFALIIYRYFGICVNVVFCI